MIRAVEVKGKGSAAKFVAAGELPLPTGAVVEGVVQDVQAVSMALQKLWSDVKFSSRNVVCGVFNQNVLMRLINFAKVPKDKLAQAIRLQAGDYFPIPLSQLEYDFAVLGETVQNGESMYEVLLVAAKQQDIKPSITALLNSKLNPQVVDAVPLALLRTLPKAKQQGTVVIVNLAMGLSSIVLVVGGMACYVRALPVNLQEFLGTPASEAVGSEDFHTWASTVANEIRTFTAYYLQQERLSSIDAVLLSGRGARINGLVEYLHTELGTKVDVLRPAEALNVNKAKAEVDLQNSDFAVSTGLALRGLEV